jgi:hypothetical protein
VWHFRATKDELDGQVKLEHGVFGFGFLVIAAAGLQSFIAFQLLAVAVHWHPTWTTYLIQVVVEFVIFACVSDSELRKRLAEKGRWVPQVIAYAAMSETVAVNLISHLIVSGGGQTRWAQIALGVLAVTMPLAQIGMAHIMSARLDRRDNARERAAEKSYASLERALRDRYDAKVRTNEADFLKSLERAKERFNIMLTEERERHARELEALRDAIPAEQPTDIGPEQVRCWCKGKYAGSPCNGKSVSKATEWRHRNADAKAAGNG